MPNHFIKKIIAAGINSRVFRLSLFVFYIVCLSAVAQTAKPDLPDLNVLYISRTPRYPAYVLKYQPLPGSGGEWMPCVADPETGEALPLTGMEKGADGKYVRKGTGIVEAIGADKIKRWPDEGEEVTFTAMVANHGFKPTGEFEYTWYIDEIPVERGKHESLNGPSLVTDKYEEVEIGGEKFKLSKRIEGTYCALEYKWKWQKGRHYVRLDLDPNDKIDEICEVNNDVSDATDACSFVIMVDALTYNTLAEGENHWKSFNFDDIIKYHRQQMHRKFKASISEFAPHGILEEIRYDVILVQATGEARDRIGNVKLKAGWDSHWDFSTYIKPDMKPEQKYEYLKSQDWGLPHELGHQLGLIDYYCFDTEGGDGGNLVEDENGDPILLSHFTGMVGMMRGHGDVHYSSVSAAALNYQMGRRRGYFGDYLWSVPDRNVIRILDFEGKPVANADIRIFQHRARYVQPDVVFSGKTDRNGEYELANRECLSFKTDNGFTIKPNPWGQINVVGTNGVFFIETKARGFTDYVWLEITAMNSEFLKGNSKQARYDLKTMIPPLTATKPLDVRQEVMEDGSTKLSWNPINQGETYAVYQRVNHPPRWVPVKDAVNIKETSFNVTHLQGNGRYIVLANAGGKISAPSKEQRVVRLANPMGITINEKGQRIIIDSGIPMPVMFRKDNSTIGIFGTFHMGLGGVGDVARTKEGNLIVLTNNRAPIRLFDAKAHFLPRTNAGEFGNGDMQFKDATGITVDSKGRVWVCDTGNGRVQVLDDKVQKVLFKIGAEAGLKSPAKAVELPDGKTFAVADSGAGKVFLFTVEGDTAKAAGGVDVSKPVYLAVSKTHLFVSDEGTDEKAQGQVLSFKIEGNKHSPAGAMTQGIINPCGIAFDEKQNVLVVVDRKAKKLVNVPLK